MALSLPNSGPRLVKCDNCGNMIEVKSDMGDEYIENLFSCFISEKRANKQIIKDLWSHVRTSNKVVPMPPINPEDREYITKGYDFFPKLPKKPPLRSVQDALDEARPMMKPDPNLKYPLWSTPKDMSKIDVNDWLKEVKRKKTK